MQDHSCMTNWKSVEFATFSRVFIKLIIISQEISHLQLATRTLPYHNITGLKDSFNWVIQLTLISDLFLNSDRTAVFNVPASRRIDYGT